MTDLPRRTLCCIFQNQVRSSISLLSFRTTRNPRQRNKRISSDRINDTNMADSVVILDMIPKEIWRNHILPFIGPGVYRYVAGISRQFKEMYTELYPSQETHIISSVAQAELACRESPDSVAIGHIAVRGGTAEALQFLHTQGYGWSISTCAVAAKYGHLHLLQWLREKEQSCPWDKSTCAMAAWGGYLRILQWARENGCSWSSCTCNQAASQGHLHVLQWAHENGCDWMWSTCSEAAESGHLHILQYAPFPMT
jgi:hypothetical protein